MAEIVSVYAVFADSAEAERIARTAVGEGLAACVNILTHCQSIYRWKGSIAEAEECPAIFKTSADRAQQLVARIAELHSYHVPAIVVWPIADALDSYADWVADETSR